MHYLQSITCVGSFKLQAVWPDWAIFWTLGNFSKHLATINLPKSPTFLGNSCKGVKIYHFSNEIIFEQHLQAFLLVTLTHGILCWKEMNNEIGHLSLWRWNIFASVLKLIYYEGWSCLSSPSSTEMIHAWVVSTNYLFQMDNILVPGQVKKIPAKNVILNIWLDQNLQTPNFVSRI